MARRGRRQNRRIDRKTNASQLLVVAVCGLLVWGIVSFCSKLNARDNVDARRDTTAANHTGAEQGSNGGEAAATPGMQEPGAGSDASALLDVVTPAGTPEQVVRYTGFTSSFNRENRTPNWVAWELEDHETGGSEKRSDKFWADENVSGTSTPDDYRRSGYDRGHLCPAADQKWNPQAMHDCFVMTNMAPQQHALNSGAWNTLEDMTRRWARRDGRLIVVAGPLYSSTDRERIGSGVRVPGAFFKAILAPDVTPARAIAFVYPNMSAPGNMQNYSMSIDELEQLTGFDFFSALPDDVENEVERASSFRDWTKR